MTPAFQSFTMPKPRIYFLDGVWHLRAGSMVLSQKTIRLLSADWWMTMITRNPAKRARRDIISAYMTAVGVPWCSP